MHCVFALTVEGAHVHWDGADEPEALVELALEELAQHVEADQLMVVQYRTL